MNTSSLATSINTIIIVHVPCIFSFKKSGRSGLERGLIFIALLLLLAVIGLVIGLVLVIRDRDDTPGWFNTLLKHAYAIYFEFYS